MTTTQFLQKLIEQSAFSVSLSPDDSKRLKHEGEKVFILSKIYSNRFKGSSFPEEIKKKIDTVVSNAIAKRKPIHFSIPFGGFKKWQFPTAPHIDWAEIFNIIQLRNLASEISAGYDPGVIIQYVSDEVFISRMNNISQEELNTYNNEFNMALAYLQQFAPTNVALRFTKIRDEIAEKEILARFDHAIIELKKNWEKLSKEEQQKRLDKTKRNYKISSKETPIDQAYFESTLVHDAFIFSDWEQGVPWAFRPDMLPVGFRYTGTWGLHLKSSASSTVQFWVGYGILKTSGESFTPTILTYNQLLEAQENLKIEETKVLPDFLNLKTINVLVNKDSSGHV